MKRNIKDNSKNSHQDKLILKALRTGGFLFPESIDEVKEFERIYGKTDIILPPELQDPTFLERKLKIWSNTKNVKFPSENFAMAAREGSSKLPNEIKLKIIKDIKNTEARRRRMKNK